MNYPWKLTIEMDFDKLSAAAEFLLDIKDTYLRDGSLRTFRASILAERKPSQTEEEAEG